jgi:hypothetical protein
MKWPIEYDMVENNPTPSGLMLDLALAIQQPHLKVV